MIDYEIDGKFLWVHNGSRKIAVRLDHITTITCRYAPQMPNAFTPRYVTPNVIPKAATTTSTPYTTVTYEPSSEIRYLIEGNSIMDARLFVLTYSSYQYGEEVESIAREDHLELVQAIAKAIK